jgi:hypothetical protein
VGRPPAPDLLHRRIAAVLPELKALLKRIVGEGTGERFTMRVNRKWLAETRPILEAYFHARYFLEMAVTYGRGKNPPLNGMPYGWAALLYLYNIR